MNAAGSTPTGTVHDVQVSHDQGDAGDRLDLLVARHCGVSRTQAATLIATGQVTVNGAVEKAS